MDTKTLVALGALLLTLVGGTVAAVDYFAKSNDLRLVEYRLDQKIRNDQIYDLYREAWRYENRYEGSPVCDWPEEDRDRYRKIKFRINQLELEQ